MKQIFILITGGTMDKIYDPVSAKLVFSDRSCIADTLKECRSSDIPHRVLMLKDSLDINDDDREIILQAVLRSPEKSIVITHGTDTMEKTASYLQSKIKDKVIVLTGALRPFSLFQSDAAFNLGCAIAAAKISPPGVYVAMNGEIFEAGNVTKDRETGFFKKVF